MDSLLCQMAAAACSTEVLAGPSEATDMGNIAVCFDAIGVIEGFAGIRKAVSESTELKRYEPKENEAWEKAYEDYLKAINCNWYFVIGPVGAPSRLLYEADLKHFSVAKNTKGWYNLSVISGKQVKILYGPAAVRHIKNRLCPFSAIRGQAFGSFPVKARRGSAEVEISV